VLHELARTSILHGLNFQQLLLLENMEFPPSLQAAHALFVTLTLEGRLRGCVGTLEAMSPLICNVVRYAFMAAFSDHRFPSLTRWEFPQTQVRISLLTDPKPLQFTSETDLLEQLQPGLDGLVLEEGPLRSTLLPAAWDVTTERRLHLNQLKIKAGLPPHYWSQSLRIQRYRAYSF
jgi:uncharacterized protein